MWVEENHNYFDLEPILLNYGKRANDRFGYGVKNAAVFGHNFVAKFYLLEDDLERNGREGCKLFMNKLRLNHLLGKIKLSTRDLQKSIRKLSKIDLAKISNTELWRLYDETGYYLGSIFTAYSMTQPDRVVLLEEDLETFLEQMKVENKTKAINILTTPKHRFIFPKKTNKLFETFEKSVRPENAVVDRTLIDVTSYKTVKNSVTQKNKLLKRLKTPRNIRHIIKVLSILAEERLKMRFVWMASLYYNELFLIEIKRRYKVLKSDLRKYDVKELDILLQSGRVVSKKTLKQREKGFLKLLRDGKIRTFEGRKAVEFLHNQIERGVKAQKVIRGRPASPGLATGPVIIFSYRRPSEHEEKMKNMLGGEVLVSEMTRPNLVLACKKASAIVTDEGGILSHAAIVSREFGIPCIVGTENATQILKDGDIVKVDAEEGTVSIVD